MKYFIIITLLLMVSCGSINNKQANSKVDGTDIEKYTLSEIDYNNVKDFIFKNYNFQSKDTIIIKYEFNNETCWDRLDLESDSRVQYFVNLRQKEIEKFNNLHSNAIALHIREEGKNFNKIVSMNKKILIDNSSFFRNLIFKEKNTCGNTIVLFKDGRYFLRRSDSHFDIIQVMNNSERHD